MLHFAMVNRLVQDQEGRTIETPFKIILEKVSGYGPLPITKFENDLPVKYNATVLFVDGSEIMTAVPFEDFDREFMRAMNVQADIPRNPLEIAAIRDILGRR